MPYVHITQCDEPKYLPFARSRLQALRLTGLRYASQQFEVDGFSIKVRKEGEQEYISISGDEPYYWVLVRRTTTGYLEYGPYEVHTWLFKMKDIKNPAAATLVHTGISTGTYSRITGRIGDRGTAVNGFTAWGKDVVLWGTTAPVSSAKPQTTFIWGNAFQYQHTLTVGIGPQDPYQLMYRMPQYVAKGECILSYTDLVFDPIYSNWVESSEFHMAVSGDSLTPDPKHVPTAPWDLTPQETAYTLRETAHDRTVYKEEYMGSWLPPDVRQNKQFLSVQNSSGLIIIDRRMRLTATGVPHPGAPLYLDGYPVASLSQNTYVANVASGSYPDLYQDTFKILKIPSVGADPEHVSYLYTRDLPGYPGNPAHPDFGVFNSDIHARKVRVTIQRAVG